MTGLDPHCNQAARPIESLEHVDVTGVMRHAQFRTRPGASGRLRKSLGSEIPNDRVLCLFDQLTLIPNAVLLTEPELATDD